MILPRGTLILTLLVQIRKKSSDKIPYGLSSPLVFLMSRLIGEPLTYNTSKELVGPFSIVNAPGDALAIAEIKFGQIAVKVAFLAMLIYALHTTFEDGEKAFYGIGMNGGIGKRDILASAMTNAAMLREMLIQKSVLTGIIGHNPGFMGDILFQDRDNGCSLEAVNHHASGFTGFPVNKRKDLAFVGIAPALGHISLITDKGFINLNSTTIGAKRSQFAFTHGLTNTVSHEPGGLESYPKGSVKLMRTKAFLRSRQQVDGLEPEVHRNMTIFKDGSNLDGKLLPAGIALIETDPGSLAAHFPDSLFASAMRANRAIGPNYGLNKGVSGFFVL